MVNFLFSRPADLLYDLEGLHIKDNNFFVLCVGNVEPVFIGHRVYRSPGLGHPDRSDVCIVFIKNNDLSPANIGDIFVAFPVDGDICGLQELALSDRARHRLEGPLY